MSTWKMIFRSTAILALLMIASISSAQEISVADTLLLPELTKQARDIVSLITAQNYSALSLLFDEPMKAALPEAKLSEAWNSLISQVGPFKKQGPARIERVAQYDAVYITCEFEKVALDIRVVFNGAGQVSGLLFTPTEAATKFESAGYVNPNAFRKSDVLVGGGQWALSGTLTMPWGNRQVPAIVLVHGSGPNDRDETIGPNKPFRDLAEGLSSKGIAVLRYEKRTKKYAESINSMIDSLTVKEETIDDALEAVKLLKGTPGIDIGKIFVLGHSLGGTLVPRIGMADKDIAGFVVLAGMAKPLEDAILYQYNYIFSLDGQISDDERQQLEKIKTQVMMVKSPKLSPGTVGAQLPLGLPAKYWLDLRGYKPAEMAKNLGRPILVLQGERDYQVTKDDFDEWKKELSSMSNVEFKLYPKLNHLFIEGEGKITPQEYEKSGHVSEEVINDITAWVNAR